MKQDYDRLEFIETLTLGNKEAKEYFEYLRDGYLFKIHSPRNDDPNSLSSIRDMAILEFIQTLIEKSKNIINNQGVKNGTTSNGTPSID